MSVWRFLAQGLGLGRVPRAPGTAASLAAGLGWCFLCKAAPLWLYGAVVLAATALAFVAVERELRRRGAAPGDDPSDVVADEVAGCGVAFLGLASASLWAFVLAWLVFRALDIAKPLPLGALERIGGAAGVMADDLAAGALAALAVALLRAAGVLS